MVEEYDLAVSSEFGGRVSLMEDLNGDGIDEIIVSDILYDRQEANGTIIFDVGKVHILSGKNGARLWSVEGEGTGYWFGYSISRAGDVNGDSIDDVIVGAYNFEYDSNPLTQRRGKIYIYSGLNGALLWTAEGEGAHNKFGYSVSDAGDVDGDGYDDIAVSAPDYDRVELNGSTTEWVGKAYIYSGLLGTVLWSVEGEVEHQRLGDGISNVGDIDFDGFDDIVVGSSRYHYSYPWIYVGRASVYSGQGGDEIFSWEGEDHGSGWLGSDHFGGYVAGVGDINEDGYNDVAVAATGHDLNAVETNAGKVYIYSGQDGALLLSVVGPEKDSGFGVGLSGAEPLW